MSLPRHLLEQAEHLATLNPQGRPKQADLRRAVSSAYYALFHMLTAASAGFLVSGTSRTHLRERIHRAFDHSEMKRVSGQFAGGTLSTQWKKALGSQSVPPELKEIADTFVQLQQKRHEADYDITERYTRSQVRLILSRVKNAFDKWDAIRTDPAAEVFLVALLLNGQIRG